MMKKLILFSFVILALQACKKDDEDTTQDFDKGAMLTNIADNRIIPLLANFQLTLTDLESSFSTFQTTKNAATLVDVRDKWKAAYLAWQGLKVFDFGPIKDYGLKASLGTFPTDTTKIDANISNGGYTLGSLSNVDAIGFPSLDYLFYKFNALDQFINNSAYEQYAYDVIQKMKSEVAAVVSAWSSYRATFISSTGTETTSAFSLLVNEFNRDYELAKNAKLGIPIGKQSLGVQLPRYVEAQNSGFSFELMRANVDHLSKLFSGDSGLGFDDYLVHLEKSSLSDQIKNNFNGIINKIDSFNGTLEEEMTSNPAELDALYLLFQTQVVLIKTDMTSSFGVLITYQDNDGD